VPLFALANAGVRVVGADTGLGEQLTSPVALGVAVGLMVGKPLGVTAATWIGVKLNLGVLPRRTNMKTIFGLGTLAGIGFTVSLFVTELAFSHEILADEAKLGILLGSFVAGVFGYGVLKTLKAPQDESAEAPSLRT
jgi:NhaA family Na+:H+ antiporter